MPLPSNDDRANWATEALDAYKAKTGPGLEDEAAMQDLIADLGHLADRLGFSFRGIAEHGMGAWAAERDNPNPPMSHLVVIRIPALNDD